VLVEVFGMAGSRVVNTSVFPFQVSHAEALLLRQLD
jgi:hypothetical protein